MAGGGSSLSDFKVPLTPFCGLKGYGGPSKNNGAIHFQSNVFCSEEAGSFARQTKREAITCVPSALDSMFCQCFFDS